MSRAEYYLLTYVVRDLNPVMALEADLENFYIWFNAPHHGLSSRKLVTSLLRLFEAGYIFADWFNRDEPFFIPTKHQIEQGLKCQSLRDPKLFYYGLTPQGGKYWEEIAQPDWNRYLEFICNDSAYSVGKISSGDPNRAEQILKEMHPVVLWAEHDTLKPWQATYWKTLPQGYQLRFEYDYRFGPNPAAEMTCGAEWWKWFNDPYE